MTLAPYIQPPHINSSYKCFQKLLTLTSNVKSKNALAFLEHVSIGLLRELEEGASLNKLLLNAMTFLICKYFFAISALVLKEDIGIPMGIDTALFWINLFLFFLNPSIQNNSFQKNLLKHVNIMGFLDSLVTFVL